MTSAETDRRSWTRWHRRHAVKCLHKGREAAPAGHHATLSAAWPGIYSITPGSSKIASHESIQQVTSELEFVCIDSIVKHEFTFTPAMSIYRKCETQAEIDRLFE